MDNLEIAIDANLEKLIDAKDRCVEYHDKAADDLIVAIAQDEGQIEEWFFNNEPASTLNEFQADMMLAFCGKISHDDFFIKYQNLYNAAKHDLVEHISEQIWNRYCDLNDVPMLDPYDDAGVRRSDF